MKKSLLQKESKRIHPASISCFNIKQTIAIASLSIVLFFSAPGMLFDVQLLSGKNQGQAASAQDSYAAEAAPLCSNIGAIKAIATGYEVPNAPSSAIDNNLETRWSNDGKGSWIMFDLGQQNTICHIDIAWFRGEIRVSYFTISTSTDGVSFVQVYSGKSGGSTASPERYDFTDKQSRYVKVTVNGNTQNTWASISEADIYGYSAASAPDTTAPSVKITLPSSGAIITGPSTGVKVDITGTASDAGGSGLKDIQIRTTSTSYTMATPDTAGDWSSWKGSVTLLPGDHSIIAKATDNAGNSKWYTTTITIKTAADGTLPPPPSSSTDKFGIAKIFATKQDGKEWLSTWDNGQSRTFNSAIDPYDKWFDTDHGEGKYVIDGKGKLTASGNYVRMYVYDPSNVREWDENLEITVYVTRISETKTLSYSGLQIFARTNHGTIGDEDENICDDRGYGAKVKNNGYWSFEKETAHHLDNGYADPGGVKPWDSLPKNTKIGIKYVLRNTGDDTVRLELYRDLTGGVNGGKWEKIYEFTDTGKNLGVKAGACDSGVDPALQLIRSYILESSETKKPMTTVYLRHEFGTMEYSNFSIREINPLL